MMALGRKLRTLSRLSWAEIAWTPLVWALLGVARLAVLTLPVKRYVRLWGPALALDAAAPEISTAQAETARRLQRVIRGCASVTPWESVCLPQAMVASALLRRAGVPFVAYLGVSRNAADAQENGLAAHAWVMAGQIPVTGGYGHSDYAVVGAFGQDRVTS